MSDENVLNEGQQPPIQQQPLLLIPPIIVVDEAVAQQQPQQPAHAAELMNPSRQLDQSPLGGGTSSRSRRSDNNNNNSDSDDEEDDGLGDSEYMSQSFANNIFSSAESGFAFVIYKLLSNLEDDETKTDILNQVIHVVVLLESEIFRFIW